MRYSIILRGAVLPLSPGATLIGRSVACKVVVDDRDASRRHARVTIANDEVFVEDLGSASGVYVNGTRIEGRQPLAGGDRIGIGAEQLQLVVEAPGGGPAAKAPPESARTAARVAALDAFWDDDGDAGREYGQSTDVNQRTHLITGAMQEMLTGGEVDADDPMLTEQLAELLQRATAGIALEGRHAETAARVALKLAAGTGQAGWVEYVLELYTAIGSGVPDGTLSEIEALAEKVGPVRARVLRAYAERLGARPRPLSPSERAGLERLERASARLQAER